MISPLAEPLQQVDRTWVEWRGQTLTYFAGCDYFRLASHPRVLAAAENALRIFGLNVAASRRTTGNHFLYDELESALADFFGSEESVLISNGYLTNLAVLQGVRERFTCILIDEKSHSSHVDAASSAGLSCQTFKHKSVNDLITKLTPNPTLILTDGVFAHDGSIAPLREMFERLPKEAWILVDDSHGAGVLGANGRGTHEYFKLPRKRLIQTTTLSKAFGCFGGAINASREICDLIRSRSNAFGGSTPCPLPCAAAALEAVRLLDDPSFRERLRENCARVGAGPAAIFSVIPADDAVCERVRCALLKRGIFPPLIRYQNSPSQGYFRFAISSEHTRAQLEALADALSEGA
jgi:7-keto-8-aminopelargonate synthetase-like enzyme